MPPDDEKSPLTLFEGDTDLEKRVAQLVAVVGMMWLKLEKLASTRGVDGKAGYL